MRNLLSWFFLIIFFASCFSHVVLVSGQCQSDQQSLLLQLKNSLVFSSTSSVKLAQWDQNTDCCNWSGVDCDEAGHVINLNLSNESISGGIENATGLFALQHLNSLNLSYNRFNATQIPSRLANLTNLTHLNLSNAGLAGQIPSSISGLTKLVTLDLSSPNFLGSSVLKLENPNLSTFLQNFTEISELYLDGVNISAQGNEWCKALSSSLPNLQVLSLSNCFLSGPITTSLAELRSLSVIRLDQNNLSSTVPGFLAEFTNLTSLRLSYCGLLGTFPENIFQKLQLANNQFRGKVPEFADASSSRLDTLVLRPIPESICNATLLQVLDLSNNSFNGNIPKCLTQSSETLGVLNLRRNNLTGIIFDTFPETCALQTIDLSGNHLQGMVPKSLANCTMLEVLDLVIGIGFGIGSAVVVAPLMFSDKVNQWYDDHIIDKLLIMILPTFGLMYKTSHQRRIEAEEDLEGKKSDEDDDDYDETETQEFRGRYCVFCSKLDFTRKRVVHDLKCTCHDSPPPISSSTSTASSSSSLAHFDQS
ncbi:hypothetical protein Pint_34902 [Pistacia integerrima]|uniref:Uncharacterized protein n=1 Tax=Pistacia integerrima TaxID=434235 RepID=A0ACC0Y252_9ROSI|nr:hypothetical protein Pint_34902 [Pistacia integerrima]